MFKFYIYQFGQFCVNRLPLKWAYRIAMFMSDMQYFLSFRDRKAVKNNLRIILGSDDNISAKAREVFRNFGLYLVEFFRMAQDLTPEYIEKCIKIENLDILKRIHSEGKGGIILTAHICNWELGGVVVSMLGYPLTAVALPHKERPVNDLFNSQREAKGMKIVPISVGVRKCVEALRNNKLVGLVADRDFTERGEVVPFLGKKASIPKGPALLSYKTGAPIVPCFIKRDKDYNFTLTLDEPLYPPDVIKDEVISQELLLKVLKQYVSIIEKKIRENPTQWLMFRDFAA